MYKKLKYYNKNRKTIGDFAMAPIGHHTPESEFIMIRLGSLERDNSLFRGVITLDKG